MLSGMNNNSNMSYVKERQIYNHSKNFDEAPRKTGTNFRGTARGFSYNKSSNKPFKDPDVWEPPPPLEKKQQPVKRVSNNITHSPNYNIRNSKNMPKGKKGQQDPNGRKGFLLERYPDGNGPDTNLIEMLEREVMDKSPKVAFDDIADL